MIPWWKIIPYVVALGIGVAGGYYIIGRPQIIKAQEELSRAENAAAQEKANFLSEAKEKQDAAQRKMDDLAAQAETDRRARDVATRALAVSDGKLRNAINSALNDKGFGLPKTSSPPIGVDPITSALGDMAQSFRQYGAECTAEVERLGDQVRGLLAAEDAK